MGSSIGSRYVHKYSFVVSFPTMVMKKAMKGAKAMSKSAICQELAGNTELKPKECAKVIDALAEVGTKQVKSVGKFTLPGMCMIKTRLKPATKAGKREVFGKLVMVKARPARTVVKAFAVSVLKKAF